jgi:hypothetical protein
VAVCNGFTMCFKVSVFISDIFVLNFGGFVGLISSDNLLFGHILPTRSCVILQIVVKNSSFTWPETHCHLQWKVMTQL